MKLLPFIPARRRRRDREMPKAAYVVLAAAFLLLQTSALFGQGAYVKAVDAKTISVSGTVFTHVNTIAELNVNAEYVITGSPTITSIILQGCMRGGTCTTLNTYTSSSNTTVSASGLFDTYTVTPIWTGGSSPTVTINWLGTSNSSPASGGVSDCPNTSFVTGVATGTQTVLVAGATGRKVRICALVAGNTNATSGLGKLSEGTGANCGTGLTQFTGSFTVGTATSTSPAILPFGPGAGVTTLTAGDSVCVTTSAATSADITVTWSYL